MSNKCNSCGNDNSGQSYATLENKISELESVLDEIKYRTQFLECGSPILMLTKSSDIEKFDTNGIGSGCWENWAVCNGTTYKNSENKNIETPNLIDRFPVGAGDTYDVGDTGGEAFHELTVAEMPVHSHAIEDPGHLHAISDDGHTHGITEEPHNHSFTGVEHDHTLTIENDGNHDHTTGFRIIGDGNGGDNFNVREADGNPGAAVSSDGLHNHDGTVGATTAGGTIGDASTNISVQEAATGIEVVENATGISVENTGESAEHENRPPYYAVLFVMWLG